MRDFNTAKNREPDTANPSGWEFMIYVSLSIVLMIVAGKTLLNLLPERSEFSEMEKVANERFNQYSERLDAISKKYAEELETINRGN